MGLVAQTVIIVGTVRAASAGRTAAAYIASHAHHVHLICATSTVEFTIREDPYVFDRIDPVVLVKANVTKAQTSETLCIGSPSQNADNPRRWPIALARRECECTCHLKWCLTSK